MLDLLVAMVLVGGAIIGSYTVISSAESSINTARQNAVACNAARQVVENVREFLSNPIPNGTYANAGAFGSVPQLSLLDTGTASLTLSTYRGTVQQAVVVIQWSAGSRGNVKRRTFTTLITPGAIAP